VAQVFRQARLYLACSLQEGLGLPPLEAMANGCAVVGFPAWGGDSFLTEAFSRSVRTGDVLALAEAAEESLISLLAEPSTWQEKVNRARTMVQENHGPDRAAASTRAAFGAFLNGETSP
jgi:glycosyltransferase involved in cell wall biosynthesis